MEMSDLRYTYKGRRLKSRSLVRTVLWMNTLIAASTLRNDFNQQEFILLKAKHTHLTTTSARTLAMIFWCVVSCAFALWSRHVDAQDIKSHPCLSDPAIAVQQTLQAPFDQPVENTFESFLEIVAAEYKLNIWCDRRIAKDTVIRLDASNTILKSAMESAVREVEAAMVPTAGVLMIVPKNLESQIAGADWRMSMSKNAGRMNQLDSKPFAWADATEPSKIIADYFLRYPAAGSEILEIERDLWKGFEFRKTTPAAIGLCLLSGFDYCLEETEGTIRVGALTELTTDENQGSAVEWTYRKDALQKFGKEHWQAWRKQWPDVAVSGLGKSGDFRVEASVVAHRELVRPLVPTKKYLPNNSAASRFTGRLNAELEAVLMAFGAKAKVEFTPLPLPPKIATLVIDVNLNNHTLDEALKLIGQQADLTFQRTGQKVEIILPK